MSMSKLALALPLTIGLACSTSGAQSSDHTGAMWTEGQQHHDAATAAYEQGTGSGGSQDPSAAPQGTASSDAAQAPASGSEVAAAGSSDSSGSSSSDASSGSSGSSGSSDTGSGSGGAMGSGGSSDTMGSSGSSDQGSPSGAADQAQPGAAAGAGNAGAHAGDQHVHGKITKVSQDEISIAQKGGQAKTLKINPDTVVQVNGKDVKPTQLKKGQFVRASYENVSGDDVAVRIESGKVRHGQAGHMQHMQHMPMNHMDHMNQGESGGAGTSGSSDAGAGGSSSGSNQ